MAKVDFQAGSPTQHVQDSHGACLHPRQNGNAITPSLPASSRVIGILELQLKIFQLVNIDPVVRKRTLLALALTCVSFTRVALDLLWRQLDSFFPLIKCLSPTLWKIHNQELTLQRAMTFDDWSTFRKYSHFVRSLDMEVPHLVSAEVWTTLGCPPFSLPLLPNLVCLKWSSKNGILSLAYIRLLVTQKLTRLHIDALYGVEVAPSVQSVLSCIPSLCPSLLCFQFFGPSVDISTALKCWSHLSSVTIRDVSDEAILHLAKLPSVRELQLELRNTPIAAETQRLISHPAFGALRDLSIECDSLAALDTFFKTLSIAPTILTFMINDMVDSTGALPVAMSHISNACARDTLEFLQISISRPLGDFSLPVTSSAYRPFYVFPNLRHFEFISNYEMYLDDATLLEMAKSWPLLETLSIYGDFYEGPHIIVNTFVGLLQHCPYLTSVIINVDWSAVDRRIISPDNPYQGFAHENLSYAQFCCSKVRYTTGVAAFLSAVAPKLEYIGAWKDCYEDHPEYDKYLARWTSIYRLVKSFSAVREQERRTMVNSRGAIVKACGEGPENDSGMESESTIYSSDSWDEE